MTKMMKRNLTIFFLLLNGTFSIAQYFNLTSDSFKVGDIYVATPKILFEISSWKLKTESYAQLDSIADFLSKDDNLVVEIGVHTDSRISDKISTRLDMRRAESIMEYLIIKGVDSKQLLAQGYGEIKLIISDKEIEKLNTAQEKEEAHAINRRTEFKIIEITK